MGEEKDTNDKSMLHREELKIICYVRYDISTSMSVARLSPGYYTQQIFIDACNSDLKGKGPGDGALVIDTQKDFISQTPSSFFTKT
jgi:hypothetical protein